MRSMWRSVSAGWLGLKFLPILQSNSGRSVVKVSALNMTSYSVVERGSAFSLDYRVYLSKLKEL